MTLCAQFRGTVKMLGYTVRGSCSLLVQFNRILMDGELMSHSAIHHKIKAWLLTSSITSMPMLGLSFAMIWFIGKFCWQHCSLLLQSIIQG